MKSETPGVEELTAEGTEVVLEERSCLVYRAGFPILSVVARPWLVGTACCSGSQGTVRLDTFSGGAKGMFVALL